ncbi:MAG TPA: hypothetical protein DHV17_03375 [Chitinophagaceae bacterium]|nr:hypothetical protein [Chitinophagaceae bacterium]
MAMMAIARTVQHNLIGKLLNHGLVFLINILIVRMAGAGDSGHYFNELYLLNILVFMGSAGMDYAAVRVLSVHPGLLAKIMRFFSAWVLGFTILLVSLLFLFTHTWNEWFRQPNWAILVFSIGNLMLILARGVLSALKRFNQQNLVLALLHLAFLGWLGYHYVNHHPVSIESIAVGYGLMCILQGFLLWFACMKQQSEHVPGWNKIHFIRSGLGIMVSALVYFAFLRVDNFFVEKYDEPVVLGNYVQCGKIGQYFLYFSSIISSTLLPFLSGGDAVKGYREWNGLMKPYVLMLIVAAVFLALGGYWFFPWLFGPEFTEMYTFLMILLPGYISLGMLTLINAVYISRGSIRYMFWGDLAGLVIVCSLDALLVPEQGAVAAAWVSSLAYMGLFLYMLAGLKKQFTLPVLPSGIKDAGV